MGGILGRSSKVKEAPYPQGPKARRTTSGPLFDFSESSSSKMSIIGIDFGTQNSYVATARAGGIEIVLNDYSMRDTPSCVSFHEKNRSMGVAAKGFLVGNSANTIFNFKRFLGRTFKDPMVQEELKYVPFNVSESQDGGILFHVKYLGKDYQFSPEQITGIFLGKLRTISEADLKTAIHECVISVPDYFGDAERRAVLAAAQIAGLNCLRLFNETTAVALTYGLYHSDLPEADQPSKNVIFVDVGYANTQIGAVAFNRGKLKILNTVVDANLGGRNLDYVLLHHFANEFKDKYKIDVFSNKRATMRLRDECEKLKKMMSSIANEIPLNIECFMNDKDVSGRMKREEFEKLIANELQRFEAKLREMLEFMKANNHTIDRIEIIGAGVRVPAIRNMIKDIFGVEPSTTLNQDEAVSRGCAIQCAILSPTLKVKDFQVADAVPYGIELRWPADKDTKAGALEVFPRNHASPFSKILTLARSEPFALEAAYSANQELLSSRTDIGKFIIHDVQPATGETTTKVKVKAKVNIHGLFGIASAVREEVVYVEEDAPAIQVQPMETDAANNGAAKPAEENKMDVDEQPQNAPSGKKTKKQTKMIELRVEAVYPELPLHTLQEYIEQENEMQAQDKAEKEKSNARNALEEYIYEFRDKIHGDYSDYIAEHDREKFGSMLTQAEDWLYGEGEDQPKSSYTAKLSELQNHGNPVAKRYKEQQERPALIEEMAKFINRSRKAVDSYHAGEEKLSHLEKADIDKVHNALNEKQQWLDATMNQQNKRALHEDPHVTVAEIRKHKDAMENLVNPILNRPKPKVAPPPAKDAKTASSAGEGDKATTQSSADAAGTDVPMD